MVVRLTMILAALHLIGAGNGLLFGAGLSDSFAGREQLLGNAGLVHGNNSAATVEPGEPRHGGKRGGHSVWASWVAPSSGVMSIDTLGSSFDTTMGVYTLEPGTTSSMSRLRTVSSDDDDVDFGEDSSVEFGVTAGQRYEIAIDGFAGASGSISLNWTFRSTTTGLPVILRLGSDRSVRLGGQLVLTVDIKDTDDTTLQWLHNGNPIAGATLPTLTLPSFKASDVGQYRLQVKTEEEVYSSSSIEVEINTEGYIAVLARNKFQDSWDSGLLNNSNIPPPPGAQSGVALASMGTGLSRGYNGTQVFSTTTGTHDPNEPEHCGVQGGASYWFAYDPPETGTVHLDTEGSDFDTILAVYTFDPPLTGYESLIPVACDNNSGANGLTSKLEFGGELGRSYFVVVDGVAGASGVAHLNYTLTPSTPPTARFIRSQTTTASSSAASRRSSAPSSATSPSSRPGTSSPTAPWRRRRGTS